MERARARRQEEAAAARVASPRRSAGWDLFALQRLVGNAAVTAAVRHRSTPPPATPVSVQRARKPRKRNKQYALVTYKDDAGTVVVTNLKFSGRPSSNTKKQGDHVAAFSLLTTALIRSVKKKPFATAAARVEQLLASADGWVKVANNNNWWHEQLRKLVARANALSKVGAPGVGDKKEFRQLLSDAVSLLNKAPGTTVANKKSTGGHGEGSTRGGLDVLESQLEKGSKVEGNPWINVLGMLDLQAKAGLIDDDAAVTAQLDKVMVLVRHAVPTFIALYKAGNLALVPDHDLAKAVDAKLKPLNRGDRAAYLRTELDRLART